MEDYLELIDLHFGEQPIAKIVEYIIATANDDFESQQLLNELTFLIIPDWKLKLELFIEAFKKI